MTAFYQHCFSMATVDSKPMEFCVLKSEDWELSLVCVPEAIKNTIVIVDPPERRESTPVELAFDVANIEGLRRVVTDTGGQLGPTASAWEFRTFLHLDCLDPEGNVVQLRQRVAVE